MGLCDKEKTPLENGIKEKVKESSKWEWDLEKHLPIHTHILTMVCVIGFVIDSFLTLWTICEFITPEGFCDEAGQFSVLTGVVVFIILIAYCSLYTLLRDLRITVVEIPEPHGDNNTEIMGSLA